MEPLCSGFLNRMTMFRICQVEHSRSVCCLDRGTWSEAVPNEVKHVIVWFMDQGAEPYLTLSSKDITLGDPN
jgi:hypothetical protein